MSTQSYTPTELVHMADKTKQSIDQLVRTLQLVDELKNKRETERRALPEEKVSITKYLEAHAGEVSIDTPTADILAEAGVTKKQGTSMHATKELKRVLQLVDARNAIREAA